VSAALSAGVGWQRSLLSAAHLHFIVIRKFLSRNVTLMPHNSYAISLFLLMWHHIGLASVMENQISFPDVYRDMSYFLEQKTAFHH
jgi:hypothetical protein